MKQLTADVEHVPQHFQEVGILSDLENENCVLSFFRAWPIVYNSTINEQYIHTCSKVMLIPIVLINNCIAKGKVKILSRSCANLRHK